MSHKVHYKTRNYFALGTKCEPWELVKTGSFYLAKKGG
jgi:hypothetical protein